MEFRTRDTIGYPRYVGQVQLVCSEPRKRPDGRRKYFACNDLRVTARQILIGYRLRWTIEFNFRDAKQFWGLEDFMNVTSTGVTNAANLSLFMVNVAYSLQEQGRQRDPDSSVLDVKADWRGYKYVEETIKMLPEKPEPILLHEILTKVSGLGRIHASQSSFSFS